MSRNPCRTKDVDRQFFCCIPTRGRCNANMMNCWDATTAIPMSDHSLQGTILPGCVGVWSLQGLCFLA